MLEDPSMLVQMWDAVRPKLADLVPVAGGWVLGLGTTVLTEWHKDRGRTAEVRTAIATELAGIAARLITLVTILEKRGGRLSRARLEWCIDRRESLRSLALPDKIREVDESLLLKATDAQLAELNAQVEPPVFFPELAARYTSQAVGSIHEYDPDYAMRVLDILTSLSMLSQSREDRLYNSRLTLQPGLPEPHRLTAVANAEAAELACSKRAQIIVDEVSSLLRRHHSR